MTTITINGQQVEAARIDELSQTILQSRDHIIPAMMDGQTVRLTVAQVLSLLKKEDLPFDPDDKLDIAGGTMSGLLTLAPSDDDPDGTASLNIPAGDDTPDVQSDGDLWADSNEDLRYRRSGEDATVYDSVNLPRPAPGEMAAGTETEPRALSAADVREGVALSKMWESSPQAITAAGALTLTHGLGVEPVLLSFELVCLTAEHGYSMGDKVVWSTLNYFSSGTASSGLSVRKDATNLTIRFASAAGVFLVLNATTGAAAAITPANWNLIVRAFA